MPEEIKESVLKLDANAIKNKVKRTEIKGQQKALRKQIKKKDKEKRARDHEALGADAPPKKVPKTLDNTREADETVVDPADDEITAEQAIDEFAKYFNGDVTPKIIITTNYRPTKRMYEFMRELLKVFPNSYYYERKKYKIKQIVDYAKEKEFTDLIFINEDKKIMNAMTFVHLPDGPTAHFKLTNVKLRSELEGCGQVQNFKPEIILNNFTTRLGQRVGRFFGALFNQQPNFKGRRVVTFHNQRDFIFFRQHRYIFDAPDKKPRLQELGPRFTLKLRWLQHGTFDTKYGEYEWKHKTELDTSRRRFFL